jgi:hypothetical protein
MNRYSRFSRRPFIPLIALAALTIFGFIVMGLWNALMTEIFKLPAITFWQAVGLFILSRILLGGFGGGPGRRGRGGHDRRREWIDHMRGRWEHMTPEQREKVRGMWKKRWDMDIDEEMSKQPEA